jgi:hypothetical protein
MDWWNGQAFIGLLYICTFALCYATLRGAVFVPFLDVVEALGVCTEFNMLASHLLLS